MRLDEVSVGSLKPPFQPYLFIFRRQLVPVFRKLTYSLVSNLVNTLVAVRLKW